MGSREILALLSDFKKRNSERYGILPLGVFGAVVRDEMRDDSDVDTYIYEKPRRTRSSSSI
jgi:predicted nucleotidyltransferase